MVLLPGGEAECRQDHRRSVLLSSSSSLWRARFQRSSTYVSLNSRLEVFFPAKVDIFVQGNQLLRSPIPFPGKAF